MKLAYQSTIFILSACLSLSTQAAEKSLNVGKTQINFQAGIDPRNNTAYMSKSMEKNGNVAYKTTYVKDGKITNYKVVSGKNKGRSTNISKDLASGQTSKTSIKAKPDKTTIRTRSQGKLSIEHR
jgi:fibronectin type 3 domain-containing protein